MNWKITAYLLLITLSIGCKYGDPHFLELKVELPGVMKEISGLVTTNDDLWAVSDNAGTPFVKMDNKGNILQKISIGNAKMEDVEAIATDGNYLFIGDVGDNNGTRDERIIYKIDIATIGKSKEEKVNAEKVIFTFPGDISVKKKKNNEHDCEAMLYMDGSIYLFTKRRTDKDSEVFKIPAKAGQYEAESLGIINTDGMVTDASLNHKKNEIALIGYRNNHLFPFILLLKDFNGSKFKSFKTERIELADKALDWQLESISYSPGNLVFFACERTKKVPATLYAIKRNNIDKLNKSGKKSK